MLFTFSEAPDTDPPANLPTPLGEASIGPEEADTLVVIHQEEAVTRQEEVATLLVEAVTQLEGTNTRP